MRSCKVVNDKIKEDDHWPGDLFTVDDAPEGAERIINVPQAVKPKLSAANSKSKAAEPVALTSPEPKAVVPKLKASESELKLAKLVAPVQPAAQEQKAAETAQIVIDISLSEEACKTKKLSVAKKDRKKYFWYYGKGVLPRKDQNLIVNFLHSDTKLIRVPSKNIEIARNDFIDLTSHMAFMSFDIIDSYQHLLEKATGHRCIYSPTFLHQSMDSDFDRRKFTANVIEGAIKGAKFW
uniref:Uncharacterized protein n=1 Tax=Ananas comosus var. bracteatus TaxID=296719 RepID=A0A6V7QGY3_ANACO|nr:unnamed protein product [Ananas comosus var. bracteatus]